MEKLEIVKVLKNGKGGELKDIPSNISMLLEEEIVFVERKNNYIVILSIDILSEENMWLISISRERKGDIIVKLKFNDDIFEITEKDEIRSFSSEYEAGKEDGYDRGFENGYDQGYDSGYEAEQWENY